MKEDIGGKYEVAPGHLQLPGAVHYGLPCPLQPSKACTTALLETWPFQQA